MNTESQLKSNTAAVGTRGKSPPMRMVLEEKSGQEGLIVGIGHDGCSASPNSQRKQVDETCKLLGAECRKLVDMTCDAATQCAQLDEPPPALQRQRSNSFRLASPSKPVCLEDKLGCSLSQLDMEGTTTRSSFKLIDYSRRKAAVKQGDLAKTPRFIHMREKQPRRSLNEAILDLEGALDHDSTSSPADRTKPVFPFKRRSLQRTHSKSLRLPATTKPIANIHLSSSLSFIDHLEEPDQESESLSTSSNHKATFQADPCRVDASDEESIQLSELDESIHLESLDEMETSNLPERPLLNRKRSNSFRLPPITKPVPLQDKLGCSLSVLDLLEDKCPGIPPIRFQVRRSSVTKQSTQTLNRAGCRTPASSSGEHRGASFCKQSASTARLQNSCRASMVGSLVSPPEYWVKILDLSLPSSDNTETNGDADHSNPTRRHTWSKSKSCSLLDISMDAEDTTSPTTKKVRRRRNRRSRNSILDKKTSSHSPSRNSNMDRSWRNLMNANSSDKQQQRYTSMDRSSSHHFITGSRIRRYTNSATAATVSPTRDE